MGYYEDRGSRRSAGSLILALTNREDYTADVLIQELRRRGAEFVRFNTEDWPIRVRLSWRDDGQAELRFPSGPIVRTEDVRSVWYRRPVAPVLPAELGEDRARWAAGEAAEALHGLWMTLDARWVNPPMAEAAALSKPEQIRRARRHGLAVPETLITNDAELARDFAARGPTICKPLGRGAIQSEGRERLFFTTRIRDEDIVAMNELGPEPYLLQRQVQKRYDLRVTVIGEELFPVRIDSQVAPETEVDWRHGDASRLHQEAIDVPGEVAERCLDLVRSYSLAFAAVDLAADTEGEHVFFEVNPSGQWAWLEQSAGVPLAARLASLLIGE